MTSESANDRSPDTRLCRAKAAQPVPIRPVVTGTPDLGRFGIRTHAALKERCVEAGTTETLVADLLAKQSLNLLVGDSGLGKSPLLYQLGICVAAGVQFLGRATEQGRVLYLDFENGVAATEDMAARLARHVGLPSVPAEFLFWNGNDAPEAYGHPGCNWSDVVKAASPSLVIIDSLSGVFGDVEGGNKEAVAAYRELRAIMQECRCAVVGIHHTRKLKPDAPPLFLEDFASPREFFDNARGPRALINGSDLRLAVTPPKTFAQQTALVCAGFRRIVGAVPPFRIARHLDEDGDPVGYSLISGVEVLAESDRTTLERLPQSFRYKEAERSFDGDARKTTEFLNRAASAGVLAKPAAKKQPWVRISAAAANAPLPLCAPERLAA